MMMNVIMLKKPYICVTRVSVCSGLFEICGIVTSLDVKLVIGLWKAIVK